MTEHPTLATAPSSTGLDANVAGALAYLLGPITGVLFLVIEKQSEFVRYHAAQSIGITVGWIALSIVMSIVGTIMGAIPLISVVFAIAMFFVSILLFFVGFALWVFLMYQAYQGREWEFPWIGAQSRKILLSRGTAE